MISDCGYWVFSSSEVVSPFLQNLDDSKELPVIGVIVSLCRREGGRVISTGVEVSVGVLLYEYSP